MNDLQTAIVATDLALAVCFTAIGYRIGYLMGMRANEPPG